ncbi:hypothetical protein F6X40_09760 [Paraburkholderia sp. UCT31]|uniref:hypothetical protein n=1 Tax=Paraburkholderia sp. UCT31 TaxID=2615209 RepID=UPI001656014B|nr:hypothetical protein [Paraburkholderia sp. UCT31]MBC8737093.1 hypothetical protein [Paraburkholderia sp. UCT31]
MTKLFHVAGLNEANEVVKVHSMHTSYDAYLLLDSLLEVYPATLFLGQKTKPGPADLRAVREDWYATPLRDLPALTVVRRIQRVLALSRSKTGPLDFTHGGWRGEADYLQPDDAPASLGARVAVTVKIETGSDQKHRAHLWLTGAEKRRARLAYIQGPSDAGVRAAARVASRFLREALA